MALPPAPETQPTEPQRPVFEKLAPYHDRKAFDCGDASLNAYLQRYARQNTERNLGITHVAVSAPKQARILGYYTLLSRSLERDLIPASQPIAT